MAKQAKHADREGIRAARGETAITVEGQTYKLAFTLAAMAELEDAFELERIGEIGERLQNGSSKDIAKILAALIRGGGASTVTWEEVRRWPLSIPEVTRAINSAFMGGAHADEGDSPGN